MSEMTKTGGVPNLSVRALLAAGVLVGGGLLDGEAKAQETSQSKADDESIKLPALQVSGQQDRGAAAGNTNDVRLGIARMPQSVKDTPQTISVVPHQLLQQQNTQTLDQALANVPGITASTGEGNGGLNGDQFRIRGLQARGDIYVDGLKDFGTYVRDMFNTQEVEVIKGPSGDYFGAANVGGVINQTLKHAHLGNHTDLNQSFGSGPLFRGTFDVNHQLSSDSAVRFNFVYNKQDVADRNNVRTDRYGLGVDYGVGLGRNTSWHFNYQFLKSDGTPDYGVSMIQVNGISRPITEYGLSRDTTYTRNFDFDRSTVHMFTSSFSSKVTPWLTITDDTRFTMYHRDYTATTPAACTGSCATSFLAGGNPVLAYGAGGGVAYKQDGWGVQNILMGHETFNIGPFKNDLKEGFDVNYEDDDRHMGTFVNRLNNQTIRNPKHNSPGTYLTWPGSGYRNADATDFGLFISERFWLTSQLSLLGTVRWDDFKSTYASAILDTGRQEQHAYRFSPSGSVIYEPFESTNIYFTFSRSYKPVGTDVSSEITNSATTGDVPINGKNLSPQQSDLVEIGAKSDFFDHRLGLTGALFQIIENNSYTYDENGDVVVGFSDSGTGRRIRGIELGVNGKLTDNLQIFTAYSYMDGKVTHSSAYGDNDAPQVPHNNLSIWANYNISEFVLKPDEGQLKLAGGVQYASGYWTDIANTGKMPDNFALNGLIEWDYKRYKIALNAYNITDHLNYASAFNTSRAVPLSGRTFIGSIGYSF